MILPKFIKNFLIVIVLIGGVSAVYFGYISWKQNQRVESVKIMGTWIGDFYAQHSRYPSASEFKEEFSYLDGAYTAYDQSFSLRYKSNWQVDSFGYPDRDTLGFTGYYILNQCYRWKIFGTPKPEFIPDVLFIEIDPPADGLLSVDPRLGEIYFSYQSTYKGRPNEKVTLLTGLISPRFFQKISQNGNVEKLSIINGEDIIEYDWDGGGIKLLNPQKVGQFPSGDCSTRTY